MKTIKKTIATVMCIVIMLTAAPLSGFVGMELNLDWINFDWLDFMPKASAATYSGTCGDNLTWSLDTNTGKLVISGTDAMTDYSSSSAPWYSYQFYIRSVSLPDGVSSIGKYAFKHCTWLTSITIPDSVTSIGSSAFEGCTRLTSVTIPDSVTSIGYYAFEGCTGLENVYYTGDIEGWCGIDFSSSNSNPMYYADNLYIDGMLLQGGLVIPDSVTSIGDYAFYGCTDLTSVAFPDSVTTIGNYAFYNCTGLTSVTIPDSVTSIGNYAFEGCTELTSITISDSVTNIGSSAFYNCTGLKNVYYTGDIEGWCGIDFGSPASNLMYYADNLYINGELVKDFVIPDGVISIGDYAFYGCTCLTSITIPDSVTSIGDYVFEGCTGLKNVYYTGDIEEWCGINFSGSHSNPMNYADNFYIDGTIVEFTGDLIIPNGATSIGDYVFYNCTGLISITIPDSVTSIGDYAFEGCTGLENVYYTGDIEGWCGIDFSISNSNPMYYADNLYINGELLKDIVIPDGVISIGDYAFYGCTCLTSITFPDSVTTIGNYAFYNCTGLINIIIPDGVTSIGYSAFNSCTGLTSVTIPDSVTIIGYDAFRNCNGLKELTMPVSAEFHSSPFYYCTNINKITLTEGTGTMQQYTIGYSSNITSYESTPWYISGCSKIIIEDGVKNISGLAFYNCTELTSITIPDSVTSIGSSAFEGCARLTSVTIPDSVTSIGNYAFEGCTELTSITIPDSVTSIGSSAFYNCTGLTSVTIPDSVTSIGKYTFYNCPSLTSITIPDSVTNIGDYAFYGCNSLEEITLPFIGASATATDEASVFGYIFGYTSKSGVTGTTSQNYASASSYYYIPKTLRKVTITNDETIPYGAFYNCSFLTEMKLTDKVKSIGNYAFNNCSSLTSITIPDGVISIGNYAFYNCTKIVTTYYEGSQTQWDNIVIGLNNSCLTNNIIFEYDSETPYYCKGSCGDGLEWTLYTNGYLSIIGNGEMADYTSSSPAPWDTYKSKIKMINIKEGITSIGNYAFSGITGFSSVFISENVKTIGDGAFNATTGLTDIYYSGSEDSWNAVTLGKSNGYVKNATKHFNHTHYFEQVVIEESTCIDEGKCKFECACGVISKVEALPLNEHTASDWITDTEAKCLTDGSKYKECTVCKIVLETGAIPATGHTVSDWITDTEAKCLADGSKYKECTVCKIVLETGAIPATGHTVSDWITDTEAKCLTDGSKHKECTVCKTILEKETIPANGHKKGDWTIAKSATTSAEGERVKRCTGCSTVLERETLPKLDPVCDYLKWKVLGDSITITGFYSGLSGDVVIPESINGYLVTNIAEKAFINANITSIKLPERVSRIYEAAFAYCRNLKSVTIPWGISSIDQAAFIGCTNLEEIKIYDDYYEEYTNDGLYFKTDDRGVLFSINRNSGNKIEVFYAPAKSVGEAYTIPDFATSAKNSAFVDCKDFSLTLSDGFDVAYNSVFFQLLSANEFIASENCVKFSTADGVLYSKDGKTLIKYPVDSDRQLYVVPDTVTSLASDSVFYVMEEEQELIMKYNLSYSFDNIVKVPAHLTVHIPSGMSLDKFLIGPSHYCVSGYTESEISAGNSLVSEEIAYWTEYWDEIRYEYSSSSVEYKMYNNYVTCMKNAYGTFEICEEDHTNPYPFCSVTGTVSPTCTKDGYDKYRCAECGYTFNVVVKATGHNHNAVVTEPTCTKQGYTTYSCACGDSYVDDYVDATGHSYTEVVTAPTCEDKGYTTYTCSCGDRYVDDYVDAIGHSYTTVVTAPTCTEQGYTTYTCECGDSYVDDYIDAIGHSYTSEVTTPATHTATGVMTYICHCGDTYTETIDKIADHNYNAVVTAPTCEDKGYTTYTCECGDSYVADYVDATGHTAGEWVVTKPATSTQSGTKTQSCTECGTVLNTQTIPALGKVNSVSVSDISLDYKASTTITPTISADAGVEYTVTYSSSNPSVASVDANGKVTTNKTGSVTITVTVTDEYGNTVSDTCNVEVKYNWWQWILVIVLFGWIWY